jgi:hypothetical protein
LTISSSSFGVKLFALLAFLQGWAPPLAGQFFLFFLEVFFFDAFATFAAFSVGVLPGSYSFLGMGFQRGGGLSPNKLPELHDKGVPEDTL